MNPDQDARLRFRQWLIDHDLEPEVAYAILESMPPFDWSEIARRDEMLLKFSDVDEQFARIDHRFAEVDRRFDGLDTRLDGLDTRLDGLDTRLDGLEAKFDGRLDGLDVKFDARFDGLEAKFEGMRSTFEGQLLGLEGRLSLRWMETTRLIVLAMMTLFLGLTALAAGIVFS